MRQYELLRHNVKYRRVTELTSILSEKVTIRMLNVFFFLIPLYKCSPEMSSDSVISCCGLHVLEMN